MIRIDRGPEPEALAESRRWRLARAVLLREETQRAAQLATTAEERARIWAGFKKSLEDGYDKAKEELTRRQYNKCAWCENKLHPDSTLDHFRPKARADRRIPSPADSILYAGYPDLDPWSPAPEIDPDRYWWLCWTWENLLFSDACNQSKGTVFPLARDSAPLPPPDAADPAWPAASFAISAEQPLLIDPAREDPIDHIRWRPINWNPVQRLATSLRLEWEPVARTARGAVTINTVQLWKVSELVSDHIHEHIRPLCEEVTRNAEVGERGDACASLRELYGHLRPQRRFVAATWDAIHALIPAWVLSLLCPEPIPRPGHDLPPALLPSPDWPASDPALPARLQWQIRDTEIPTAERVLLLCRHAPQDRASLARLLPDKDRAYLGTILRDMETSGRLNRRPDDTYVPP